MVLISIFSSGVKSEETKQTVEQYNSSNSNNKFFKYNNIYCEKNVQNGAVLE